ncbi:alpha/beta hydrolase [Cohnella suwonensis]|uniref:Alpha/beta hydrolase n=1 Tax=Cohnella suwonensis TaxID=696072 RepID=A0ABW0M1W0_9BACL
MTTLSTPFPLAGSAPALPATERPTARGGVRKLGRIALRALVALCCLISVAFVALHGYAAWLLSHPPVVTLGSNPMLAKQLTYSDVTFPSSDGNSLVDGWWIPSAGDGRRTVVLSHGFGANREELWVPMYDLAELLHRNDYNVLMFDYAYASAARRGPATGGISESRQLSGAIQFARGQGSDEVVVWGFSMGAGTALQAALQGTTIDAMILDSTFIADGDTLYANIGRRFNVPKYPSVPLIEMFFPLMSGSRLEQIPSDRLQDTAYGFPIFLIHGTSDDKAPVGISERVAQAQTNALSRSWIVPGAIHEMIYRTHTDEYVQRTEAFLASVHEVAVANAAEASVHPA